MIIDGPNTIDLAIGTDRRIIEPSDAQLSLPPTLVPVLLNARPHSPAPTNVTTVFQGSALSRDTSINQAPSSGATSVNVMMLDKGLWELEITLTTLFDYTTTPAIGSAAEWRIFLAGVTMQLLRRMAFIGSFVDYNRVRLLLTSASQINLLAGATAAAQNSYTSGTVNAIKIL